MSGFDGTVSCPDISRRSSLGHDDGDVGGGRAAAGTKSFSVNGLVDTPLSTSVASSSDRSVSSSSHTFSHSLDAIVRSESQDFSPHHDFGAGRSLEEFLEEEEALDDASTNYVGCYVCVSVLQLARSRSRFLLDTRYLSARSARFSLLMHPADAS
jgi:hypothetical protein